MGDEMHGQTVDATTEDPMKKLQAELLASFEGSHPAPQEEAGEVSTRERDIIVSLVKNPKLIDDLSPYDARACVEEVNRVFCGGKYDYMLPNATHNRLGVQFDGVREDGTWDDKATLRQMCQDVAWMEAAQKGVGELQKILDTGYGAKLGMTGDEYAGMSLRDKAKRVLDAKAIAGADELSESFKTWMNSWSAAQKPTHHDVAVGAVGGAVLTRKEPNADWLKAMRKPYEYDDADVGVMVGGRYHYEKVVTQQFKKGVFWDTPEKFEYRPNDNGMVTVDGKKYTLVSTDDKGKKLARPYFKAEDGSTLEGYISGINQGAHDYYKFSDYDEKNPAHAAAVKNAMQKVGATDMNDFGEKVWMSGGRVLEVDGDRFFARRVKDGYKIEVGDGGRSEYEWNVVSKFQDQFDNERNAMNAIMVREIFRTNPEVLRWYNRYMETAKDNVFGRLDRRGDWDKVFNEFMDEFKKYAKDDAELSEEDRAKKREYETTFAQFIDVLQMTDHREGFGYLGSKWTDWASGAGNVGLQFVNSTYNMFADGLSFYAHLADSESTYFDRFKSWARDDMKVATATQIYDQGTLTGLVGGEAAQLLAFSAVMKVGSAARLLNYAGRTVNATGRAMKGVGLVKAGQKVKSVGQSLVEASRSIGGGTKTALGGFRRIEVKAGSKVPKNAIRVGEEWYVQDVIQKPVGNFMQQANAKSMKIEEEIKSAIDKQKNMAAQMTGRIGVDEAAWEKVYSGIEDLEKMAAKEVGARYGQVSQWCMDLANELPALVVTGGAMADAHKAMSAYSIGQGFVKRDKNGKATGVEFDYKPLEVAEKYAIYNAAGNTVFMLHIPRVLKSLVAGEAGTRRAQVAARGWYNSVMEAMQKGEYNRANALLLMYENAPRRLMAGALHGAAIGAGMSVQSQITANAENIALEKLENPERVFTVEDYLLDEEQAWNTVKSAGRMAAGMVAVGATAGALREVPNLSRNWRMVTAMKRFGDANLDLWAMMAGAAHVKGKQPIDMSRIDTTNPDAAAKQMRQILQADAETYSQVSADTNEFITRAVSREARFGDIGKLRDRMVQKYGEDYARVMDGIIDYVKTSPELMSYYASEYADQRMREEGKPRSFTDYGIKDVVKGVGDLLGVKIREPRKLGDGKYVLNIDVGGKKGFLNLVFRSQNLDAGARKQNDDGTFSYAKGFAVDVMDGLKGTDPTWGDEFYGDLKKEVAGLSEADAARLRDGDDVNGILTKAWDIMQKAGGGIGGKFEVLAGEEVDGGIGTRKVATMNSEADNLTITDFAHETVHGIVEQLRQLGYFKRDVVDADGNKTTVDDEDSLRRMYGASGTEWEEPFVRDLLTQQQNLIRTMLERDGVKKLFEGSKLSKLIGGIGELFKLPFAKGRGKPVRSAVEKALDAKVEEAKRVQDDAKIEEAAEEIKIQDELPEDVKADMEEKTPESTALVVSRNPIPNSVMMKDVPEDAQPQRRAELNASGFYYDSQHDMWVNEFSAPTLFHRAVNEAIATKVKTQNERMNEAFSLFQKAQSDIAAVVKAEQEKGSTEDAVKQVRDRIIEERRNRIRELVSPEDFTKAERDKMGIVVNQNGEPLGVVVSEHDFISDGKELYSYSDLPPNSNIVPYDHDLYGRWVVKATSRALADRKMIALHNLPPKYAEQFLRTGKTAGISVAVQPEGVTHNGFGMVTFAFGRKTIDPAAKDANGNRPNFLFDKDMGLPVYGDFDSGDERNRFQKENDEWNFAVDEHDQPIRFDTPEKVGKGMYEYMTYMYDNYPTGEQKRSRRKTVDALRKDIRVDADGNPYLPNMYGEAKLARLVESGEIIGVSMPRFSEEMRTMKDIEVEQVDVDGVRNFVASKGYPPDAAGRLGEKLDTMLRNGDFIPDEYKPCIKKVKIASMAETMDLLDKVARMAEAAGIPVEYWDTKSPQQKAEDIGPRTEAIKRLQERVPEMRFGVVGSRGASRYFAEANESVDAEISSVINEAMAAVDEGTRKGLKSSHNAELNKWLAESGKDKFGPFILHIGGTDGDPLPRLEYAGRKPKIPQGFLDRINNGEAFRLYDFIGDANKDEVFKKAYPELQDTPVFTRHSAAKNGVKEPAWGDDNTFVLANEDGQIVIDERKWNPRTAPEQIAQAVVGLVQKTEGWQERIRQSDARVVEALSPTRQKRMNSDLAFRLSDPRLILGDRLGRIVEDAIKKRLGKSLKDSTLKDVAEAIIEKIRTSVKDFAGEAEARFLASRFGLPEEKLRDYSEAEKVFKDTLVAFGEGMTSEVQTKKNLAYWDDVILRAVDVAIFGKDNAGKLRRDSSGEVRDDWKSYSIRPEFRDAIANETLEAIVRNIMSGSRAARTDTEARLAGLLERGDRGRATGGDERDVAYADGERTLSVEADIDGIDAAIDGIGAETPEPVDTRVIITGTASIDAKWEKAKFDVAKEIREELARVRDVVKADVTKAQSEQERLMKKIRKLIDDNSTTTDPIIKDSMFSEALNMARGGDGRWRVVGSRRTPKRLLTEAAAARIAKSRLDGHRNDDATRTWLEERARRIGVIEANRSAFVAEVMSDASAIADAIVARSTPPRDGADIIRSAEAGTAQREFVKRVLNGFRAGYATGSRGSDAELRAKMEADRIRTNMAKDARGMSTSELNSLLGGDIVKDLVEMRDTYGSGDALAIDLISKFSDWMMRNDPRFRGMTKEEFEASSVARNELARTVSSWLVETSRQLAYGQTREWAMREAARLQKQPQTFGAIHMTIAKHAEHMADAIDEQNVDALLDRIDKQIDTFADGDAAVSQSVPDYKRKIAPRLQEYWKYVKKAMRMTEDAADKEARRLNGILNLTDQQLLDLGTKGSGDLDAAESGLREREDAMMKLNAIMRFGSMKYKNYGECISIFNGTMANELAGEMQRHMVMRERRLADDAAIRQAFIGELTAIRRSMKGDDFDALDNGTRMGNFLTFSVADLFRRMQLYLHEGTDAWNFVDSFRQQMSLGHIDKTMFISEWEGKMREAVQRIYGVNFERLVEDMMAKRPEYDKFSRSHWAIPENAREVEVFRNGKKRKVKIAEPQRGNAPTHLPNHLSKANLLYIYAACQQSDMQVNNLIWGRDAAYLREIENIIGPEGVQMARWLTKAYSEIRKTLDPISREISGMPILSPDERYCPLSFIQEQVSNDERRFTSSPFPAFLTRRVTHDSLRLNEMCDAFRTFEDKIQDSGHYLGFARIIDRMNTTLKHPKVQTAYAQLYGSKAKNDIYAQLADALNGGRKNSDTMLNGVRNFVTATSLFGNIGSSLKQLEGIGGWAVEMGIGKWLKSLVINPATSAEVREGVRELIDAGLFKTRAEEGISEAMVALMNSCDGVPHGPVSRTYSWYKRHGMDITKFVDKIASMSMAGQYYVGRRNWYIKNGLREEDSKRRALADTDYAIQTTQQSGRSEFLHAAQRGGTGGKMLTQFSGPAFVRWGIECASWHRAVVMGDRGAFTKLLSRMVALHLICPAILSLAGGISMMMFKRDDQKSKDIIEQTEKDIVVNCLTGPMSGWFIYGQVINAFANETVMAGVKEPRAKTHFEAPVLSKLHTLQQLTSKMFGDVVKAAPWDRFSEREQKMIAEDALRIFEMLIPATRVARPVKSAVDALTD